MVAKILSACCAAARSSGVMSGVVATAALSERAPCVCFIAARMRARSSRQRADARCTRYAPCRVQGFRGTGFPGLLLALAAVDLQISGLKLVERSRDGTVKLGADKWFHTG